MRSRLEFDLLTHHKPIFLFHYDRLNFLLPLIAVANGNDVAKKVEISLIDRSSEVFFFIDSQAYDFILVDFDLIYLDPAILPK